MDKLVNKGKIDQHEYLIAWSTGMNDYEISEKLGVSIETVQEVKADLLYEEKEKY